MRKGLLALAAISAVLSSNSIAPFLGNAQVTSNRRDRMKRSRNYTTYLEDMNDENLSEEDKNNIEKAKLKQVIKNEKRRMASKKK